MGFWESIGTGLINGAQQSLKEINQGKKEYASYTDEEPFKIIHDDRFFGGPSESKKIAAKHVLLDRGYDAETVGMKKG